MRKMKVKKTEKYILASLGLLSVFAVIFGLNFFGIISFQALQPEPTPTDRVGCNLASAPSVTFNSIDKYTRTADTTGSAIHFRKEGGLAWTSATPGTAIASVMNAFENFDVVFYDDNTARYGKMISYEVPCQENPSLDVESVAVATASAMSGYTDNPDGTQNSNSNQWAMGANSVKTFTITIGGESEKSYGNPYCGGRNVLVFEYNSTEIDGITSNLAKAETPTQHSVSAIDHKTKAFYVDPIEDTDEIQIKVTVDSDDSVDPTEDITWTLYDVQYYFDKYSGDVLCDVEDELDADLGIATELSGTIYQS